MNVVTGSDLHEVLCAEVLVVTIGRKVSAKSTKIIPSVGTTKLLI
jgi:hypothetical protein